MAAFYTNNAINTRSVIDAPRGGTGAETLRDHGVLVGSGTDPITAISVGTDGQAIVGATGADPAAVTLTSTGTTIAFTPGANTLNLESLSSGFVWNEETGTSETMAVSNGYIANNAGEVNLTLPATASVGDIVSTTGKGAGIYRISQNAGQTIYLEESSTKQGPSGYITADEQFTSFNIICTTENTGWTVRFTEGDFSDEVSIPVWTSRTSGFGTDQLRGIAYDGSTNYATCGAAGKLFTATDPTSTWTSRTSEFDTSLIYKIAYGNSVWVAVGEDGKLSTATDPTGTWTARTSGFDTDIIYSVAYGNSVWVAVGVGGKLFTATDPTSTWTSRTSGFTADVVRGVYYDDSVWVIVGSAGKLATATDPTSTWTLHSDSTFSTSAIRDVYYGDSIWVIVGDDGKLATATDPTSTWTSRTSGFSTTDINAVYYDDRDYWIIGGDTGTMAYATDPTGTWTITTSGFSTTSIYNLFNNPDGDGLWIAVGATGKLFTGI